MAADLNTLTEKEKQTLRLIVRGHDAKSAARELDLSVHTVNERLRNARRKLDVTSSREAARLLLEDEAPTHENLAAKRLGEAVIAEARHHSDPAGGHSGRRPRDRFKVTIVIGGLIMFSTLALSILAGVYGGSPGVEQESPEQIAEIAREEASTAEIITQSKAAALAWLALVDSGDWRASFDTAGEAFRAPNTVDMWREASQQARTPLGNVESRVMAQYEPLNAPPNGFHIVRFRTDFSAQKGAIETVTLEREEGGLKVVGYFIS